MMVRRNGMEYIKLTEFFSYVLAKVAVAIFRVNKSGDDGTLI